MHVGSLARGFSSSCILSFIFLCKWNAAEACKASRWESLLHLSIPACDTRFSYLWLRLESENAHCLHSNGVPWTCEKQWAKIRKRERKVKPSMAAIYGANFCRVLTFSFNACFLHWINRTRASNVFPLGEYRRSRATHDVHAIHVARFKKTNKKISLEEQQNADHVYAHFVKKLFNVSGVAKAGS